MSVLQIRRLGNTRDQLGESPYWDGATHSLGWVDGLAATWGLGRYTPTTWFLGLTGIEAVALVLAIWTLIREGKAERG